MKTREELCHEIKKVLYSNSQDDSYCLGIKFEDVDKVVDLLLNVYMPYNVQELKIGYDTQKKEISELNAIINHYDEVIFKLNKKTKKTLNNTHKVLKSEHINLIK